MISSTEITKTSSLFPPRFEILASMITVDYFLQLDGVDQRVAILKKPLKDLQTNMFMFHEGVVCGIISSLFFI